MNFMINTPRKRNGYLPLMMWSENVLHWTQMLQQNTTMKKFFACKSLAWALNLKSHSQKTSRLYVLWFSIVVTVPKTHCRGIVNRQLHVTLRLGKRLDGRSVGKIRVQWMRSLYIRSDQVSCVMFEFWSLLFIHLLILSLLHNIGAVLPSSHHFINTPKIVSPQISHCMFTGFLITCTRHYLLEQDIWI